MQFPAADLDGHGSRGGKVVSSSVPIVPGFAQLLRRTVFVLSSTSNHLMVVSSTSSTWSICWVASVSTGWEAWVYRKHSLSIKFEAPFSFFLCSNALCSGIEHVFESSPVMGSSHLMIAQTLCWSKWVLQYLCQLFWRGSRQAKTVQQGRPMLNPSPTIRWQ